MSRRAALWSWRSRMSECLPCRSSVPLSASHPVRLACPVEGTVSGRTRPGMRCPEPVRSWRPSWTPDTAAWTLDGDQAGGRFGTAGLAEGGHAHCRLSGQSQDEQAAWLAVAGWLGAWSGAGRRRCPPLGRRRPDWSVPIGKAVTVNWGCPADRTVERSAMSVARSAHCRVFAGGTDRRRRCPGRVSGGRTLAEAGAQTDCAHVRQGTGEVLEVPTRRSRVGCAGRRAAPARKPAPATDRVDGRVWRRVGHRVSVSGSRLSALAGRGSARWCVVPRRADRLAGAVGRIARHVLQG